MHHAYPPRLEALTALRFIAAVVVVVAHGAGEFGLMLPPAAIYGSAAALSFFFVLSGFILAWNYPVLHAPGARRRFLWLRFARVWPLHVFAIVVFVACAPRQVWVADGIDAVLALALHLTLLQAWIPVTGYVGAFNPVAWTLSVDVFFYLVFPWLLAPVRRAPWLALAAALAVSAAGPLTADFFAAARSDLPLHAFNPYALDRFFPPSRLVEFVLGMAGARAFVAWRRRLPAGRAASTLLEVVAIVAAILAIGSLQRAPYAARVVGPAVADWLAQVGAAPVLMALIVALAHGRGAIAAALAAPTAIRLGELGFAVYLLHLAVLFVVPWPRLTAAIGGVGSAAVFATALLGVAYVAWRFVEVPARQALVRIYERRASASSPASNAGTS